MYHNTLSITIISDGVLVFF